MATKRNPGQFDCYAEAADDEPIFVLRANDPLAPHLVLDWAIRYEARKLTLGTYILNAKAKVMEALRCAAAMEKWLKEHDGRA